MSPQASSALYVEPDLGMAVRAMEFKSTSVAKAGKGAYSS